MAKRKEKAEVPDMISSYKQKSVTEKVVITEATPDGFVKARALINYAGMTDLIFKGEILLLPERRFKSLAFRGYVEEYNGDIEESGKR
jgi:hypothetical protein